MTSPPENGDKHRHDSTPRKCGKNVRYYIAHRNCTMYHIYLIIHQFCLIDRTFRDHCFPSTLLLSSSHVCHFSRLRVPFVQIFIVFTCFGFLSVFMFSRFLVVFVVGSPCSFLNSVLVFLCFVSSHRCIIVACYSLLCVAPFSICYCVSLSPSSLFSCLL